MRCKLTDKQVVRSRKSYRAGMSFRAIAEGLGVSSSIVRDAVLGISYAHVDGVLFPSEIRSGSSHDKFAVGNRQCGSMNGLAKLDEVTVSYIKWHLSIGVAQCLLVKYFKVHKSTINFIACKRTWKHVKPCKPPEPSPWSSERKLIRLRGERLAQKLSEVLAKPLECN